jgi:hypothetical protein
MFVFVITVDFACVAVVDGESGCFFRFIYIFHFWESAVCLYV